MTTRDDYDLRRLLPRDPTDADLPWLWRLIGGVVVLLLGCGVVALLTVWFGGTVR
ncbi:MAG: hypothetical protein ACO1SX_11150 [Actinomycetota bacterium]